eukprot:7946698-Pyramimonas_sp.AAC.1
MYRFRRFALLGQLSDVGPDFCKPRCRVEQRIRVLRVRKPVPPDDVGPTRMCGGAIDHPLADSCDPPRKLAVLRG